MVAAPVFNIRQNLGNSFDIGISSDSEIERSDVLQDILSPLFKFTIHQTDRIRLVTFEKEGWYQLASFLSSVSRLHFGRNFETSEFRSEQQPDGSNFSFKFEEKMNLRDGNTRESTGRVFLKIMNEDNHFKIRCATMYTVVKVLPPQDNE